MRMERFIIIIITTKGRDGMIRFSFLSYYSHWKLELVGPRKRFGETLEFVIRVKTSRGGSARVPSPRNALLPSSSTINSKDHPISLMPVTVSDYDVHLTLPGSSDIVKVALLGATVYSYVHKGTERLFKSSKSSLQGPAAIRGGNAHSFFPLSWARVESPLTKKSGDDEPGIPICWPVFGPPPPGVEAYSRLKQHGLARTSIWTYDPSSSSSSGDSDGSTSATFRLTSSTSSLALFPSPFSLAYTVTLSLKCLHVSLTATALDSPLSFQALLHTYVRLPLGARPAETHVTPLGGLTYVDKVNGGERGVEERAVVEVEGPLGEVDRVYFGAKDSLEISWRGEEMGRVEVRKEGLRDVVVGF